MNASATTTTATANAISTAALSAYLKPLLKKHELGQLLILDDLMQAWDGAVIHCGENASIQVRNRYKYRVSYSCIFYFIFQPLLLSSHITSLTISTRNSCKYCMNLN